MVQITPNGNYDKYYIKSKDANGFTVVISGADDSFSFDWVAMAKVKVAVDAGSHLDDIFYQDPIEITGDYPTIEVPNTLVQPDAKK